MTGHAKNAARKATIGAINSSMLLLSAMFVRPEGMVPPFSAFSGSARLIGRKTMSSLAGPTGGPASCQRAGITC